MANQHKNKLQLFKLHNLLNFAIYIHPQNHHHSQDNVNIRHPQESPLYLLPFPGTHWSAFCHYWLVSISKILCKWNQKLVFFFCQAFFTQNKFFEIQPCFLLLLLLLSSIPFYRYLSIYLSIYMLKDDWVVWEYTNKVPMNLCVKVFIWTYALLSLR